MRLLRPCGNGNDTLNNMPQQPFTFQATITKQVTLKYLLWLPNDYTPNAAKQFPLILFLHGSGERGDDLDRVKRFGIPKILEQQDDFPFIVVSPQCPAASDWGVLMDELLALLDYVAANFSVNCERIYLTGLSMGGRGAYQLAFISPQRFAAMVVISARRPDILRSPDRVSALKHLPIWIFHGAQDARTPVTDAQEMDKALHECGGNARLTIYPDAGHDAWTRTYANPKLFEWLLAQKRESK